MAPFTAPFDAVLCVIQILTNVCERLMGLHVAGYVHRDLKPANVMWLPRQNRWTLIGFGSIARIGTKASLNFTFTYAAPEVITAFAAGELDIEASPALDAWSLGVMAFELLTGAPAFKLLTHGALLVRLCSLLLLLMMLFYCVACYHASVVLGST